MMPVAPCSPSNISFVPGTSFTTRKNRSFSRYSYAGQPAKQSLSSQRFFITLSQTKTIFPQLSNGRPSLHLSRFQRVSAIGTDVAVEVQDIPVSDEVLTQEVETNEEASAKSVVSNAPTNGEASAESDLSNAPITAKKRRGRKSEMPPVKDEDLIPGAIFTGKVRSIQPFGAFVDFGAFTDGLVHLSRLSESFVKDVNDVVTLGQEVKVRLVEANTETGRISLSMRDDDASNDSQTKTDKPRSPRNSASREATLKKEFKKTSKFTKGQDLVGTVKNFGRSGAFISLPEGEEGFLPTSEEPDDGFGNIMGQTSLEVGQEVKVRVLRIARGIMTLTMKTEEDVEKLESKLNQGVVYTATNPFAIAFRRNKDVAAFLDDREKIEEQAGIEVDETIKQANSNDSEDSSESNVSQSVVDVASLITEDEVEVKAEANHSEAQDDTPILEVQEEFPAVEAKEETSTLESNETITSSSEGANESSPQ